MKWSVFVNRVISWLQSIRLRQILTVFLVVLTFVVSTAFDKYGNELQAQAEPVTPEATGYQVDRANSQLRSDAENVKENAQNSAKDLARDTKQAAKNAKDSTQDTGKNLFQNIKEKLNLDEPIDPGTKQAFEQLKDTASETVKAPQRALEDSTR